jgi:hypothetical protein
MTEVKKTKYDYLGTKLPPRMKKEVFSYIEGCPEITDKGKRCSRAFNYIDNKGNKISCENFCLKNCDKWIDNVINNLPISVKINDIKLKIISVSFFVDDKIWKYVWNDDEWVDENKKELNPKNVKTEICKEIKKCIR